MSEHAARQTQHETQSQTQTQTQPQSVTSGGSGEASTGQLLTQLTEQTSTLVRRELELAQAEMQQKAKGFGLGAGMFGGAGLVALYGLGTLIATAILALALLVPAWLAALIVTVVLFVIAAVAALLGKKKVSNAAPLTPGQTIDNVKADVATLKGNHQ